MCNKSLKFEIFIDLFHNKIKIKFWRILNRTMEKLLFFMACLSILSPQDVNGSDKETALINRLLHNYNPFARPVVNDSSTLNLEIILTLKQIINLDVRKQVLKTKLWLEYYWKDKNLVWNPVSLFFYSFSILFFYSYFF